MTEPRTVVANRAIIEAAVTLTRLIADGGVIGPTGRNLAGRVHDSLDAALAATPPALDVERLARAMGAVFGNAVDPAHLRMARVIAAEYAALSTGDET